MRYFLILSTLVLLCSQAGAQTGLLGNPTAGQLKSRTEVCQECHGEDGNSGEAKFPRLAGQHQAYLIKQLQDFQSGARKHEVMTGMAAGIHAEDIIDITAWFATNAPQKSDATAPRLPSAIGRRLFTQGDGARGIPACAGCHGEDGRGRLAGTTVYPAIAGQYREYLRAQLLDWRIGARTNSPGAIMNRIIAPLSNEEISAVADYAAGL